MIINRVIQKGIKRIVQPTNLSFKAHPSRLTTSQWESSTGTRSRQQEIVREILECDWTRRGIPVETVQSEGD